MERILGQLPSFLILGGIASVSLLWVLIYARHNKENLKSIRWLENNQGKLTLIVGIPLVNIFAPAFEELVFRAPLIVGFESVSYRAWWGIIISSLLFSFVHVFNKHITLAEITSRRMRGEIQSDDLKAEITKLSSEMKREVWARKIAQLLITFFVGILSGYYGIKFQSIWVSFGIHAVWNLVSPFVVALVILLLGLVLIVASSIFHFAWRRVRRVPLV